MEKARIPLRYGGKTLESFDRRLQPRALDLARRYVDRFDELRGQSTNGLCFIGPVGTGKSHLAMGIAQALLDKGVPVIFRPVAELLEDLRPRIGRSDEETRRFQTEAGERLELLRTADMVVLDDLGAEKSTEWAIERIYLVVNARYNALLPTVITSNVPLEDLELLPNWERIVSRIWEMCFVVQLRGADYRRRRSDDADHK